MVIQLPNGMTLQSSNVDRLWDAIVKLGYEDTFHRSEDGRIVEISTMHTNHLRNYILKEIREYLYTRIVNETISNIGICQLVNILKEESGWVTNTEFQAIYNRLRALSNE